MKIVAFDTYPNEIEAQLISQLLEDEGIQVVVKPLGSGYGGLGVNQWIHHRVYVPEDDLEKAQNLIEEIEIVPDENPAG